MRQQPASGALPSSLPAETGVSETRTEDAQGAERRKHARYVCDGQAVVSLPHGGLRVSGRVRDLSVSGCFVESASINLERGTQVEVYFETERLHFRVAGNVTVLRKGNGVGVAFLNPSPRLARQIRELVKELAERD